MCAINFALTIVLASLPATLAADHDWPEFRGPRGDGTADVRELPLVWSEKEHVLWKTAIPGRGWSTPAVGGGRIWVTTATPDGKDMSALAVDGETGRIVHDLHLFHNDAPQPLGNPVNGFASPSPALDGDRVYAHFGSYGTACLDAATGKTVWERRDLPCDHFRGPGSSPVVYQGLLILTMDGFDVQYLAALDKATGKTVWRTDRSYDFRDLDGDLRKAYSTPLFIQVDRKPLMVSPSAKAAYAYDPASGEEIWKLRYDGFSNAARPVFIDGLVLINTGFGKADLWAVRPDGRGDVTDTHVEWRSTQGIPLKPSPVAAGGLVFMASEGGIATCLEARNGKVVWKARVGGDFSASPVLAAGRVYFPDEEGKTTVVRAARDLEVLAENVLDAGCMASPAVSGKSLILRTRTHLYRIQ